MARLSCNQAVIRDEVCMFTILRLGYGVSSDIYSGFVKRIKRVLSSSLTNYTGIDMYIKINNQFPGAISNHIRSYPSHFIFA